MFFVENTKVTFRHSPDDHFGRSTHCKIFLAPDDEQGDDGRDLIATGMASCHPKDQYDKNVGRKIALSRALKMLTDDRVLRKTYWDAYFAKRKGKW